MSKSAEFYKRLEIPAIDKVLKKHGYSDELRETYKKTHARRGTFQTAPENLDSIRLLYNTWITRTKLLSMLCEKGYDVYKLGLNSNTIFVLLKMSSKYLFPVML